MAGGRLLASADSGATWKTVRTDPALIGVSFPPSDRLKGWLVTSDGLLESVDAGTTWTPVPGTPRSVTWAQRIDAADGFALTAGNQLQRTTDGGATWVPVATPAAVVGACFVSPQLGLVTTSQPDVVVFRTDDGGASWHRSLERSSGAEYANLDCTPRIAHVDIEYQSSMHQGPAKC